MNLEIIEEAITTTIRFPDLGKDLIDIDVIFRRTNFNYCNLMSSLGLPLSFDFSKRNNKRLYTHEFLKTFMEFLKERQDFKPYFFSDIRNKDKHTRSLIKKLGRIFGTHVWPESKTLSEFALYIKESHCGVISHLELFFSHEKRLNFQKIRKNLEKEGLTFLNEVYFEDFSNKLTLFVS